MSEKFDVVVIGAGPGGYVCAIRAAQLGKKVAIVEAQHLGGICLNWGCIPTKSMLRSAEVFHLIKDHKSFGLLCEKYSADLEQIVARSRNVAAQLSNGVAGLLKKNKVTVITGKAKFLSSTKIAVTGEQNIEVEASKFVISTGAKARTIPNFEPDGDLVLTYKEAMMQKHIPKKLIVVGSGAIGVEFASFYNSIGSQVTLLEAQDRILPAEDKEIADFAKKDFEKFGIKIETSVSLKKLAKSTNEVELEYEHGGKLIKAKAEKLIMAVGIAPNTQELGLDRTKVKLDEKNFIKTGSYLQTDDPNIYAIGDVTLGPWLAHKASHEGIIAAEHLVGLKVKPINKTRVPGCTYSTPQIASVGISEERAKADKLDVKIGKFLLLANGKAIALGDSSGFVKLIFAKDTGELLGAHMVGPEVTELINSMVLAMNLEATEEDIFHTIFPHPTLSESIHEAALQAFGRAIHI